MKKKRTLADCSSVRFRLLAEGDTDGARFPYAHITHPKD